MSESSSLPEWDSVEALAKRPVWHSASHTTPLDNPWLKIERHVATAPTGHLCDYGLVRFKNRAIGAFPLHEDGTVTLVGQARFPLGTYSWEIPEGGAPFDEDPLDGAKRELREEAGLVASDWREILSFDMSNSVTDEVCVCYLALDLSQHDVQPDETEVFEMVRVPFKSLLNAVILGHVRDGITMAATLRVFHMAVSGQLPKALAAHIWSKEA